MSPRHNSTAKLQIIKGQKLHSAKSRSNNIAQEDKFSNHNFSKAGGVVR